MKISRSVTLRVNQGNYEHVETTAMVEFDTDDVNVTTPEEAAEFADGVLGTLLKPDVETAAQTAIEESFVHNWKDTI